MSEQRRLSNHLDQPSKTRTGVFESVVQRLFTRQANVESVEDLTPKFRLVTLRGDGLKTANWTPGDKIQVCFGGWIQRTYTPVNWDKDAGRTQLLIYLHTDGPGTGWARSVQVGDACTFFGPRGSIDLCKMTRPAVFFGDETTFGLASALQSTLPKAERVEFLFEINNSSESQIALTHLGLSNTHLCVRKEGDTHLTELESRMLELLNLHKPLQFVLSGRSTAIQRLRQLLKKQGRTSNQFQTRAYWAPGKKGLD